MQMLSYYYVLLENLNIILILSAVHVYLFAVYRLPFTKGV